MEGWAGSGSWLPGEFIRITPVTDKSNGKKNSQVIEHLKTKYNKWLAQFSSVAQSCPILCDPMNCSTPCFPVNHQLPELAQTHVHRVVMPSNHLILCRPLLLPSNFPIFRVSSNDSVLCINWPKYWSSSFSISPSNDIQD